MTTVIRRALRETYGVDLELAARCTYDLRRDNGAWFYSVANEQGHSLGYGWSYGSERDAAQAIAALVAGKQVAS